MHFSTHTDIRSSQRCFSKEQIDFIIDNAKPEPRSGGAVMYMLKKRFIHEQVEKLKREIKRLQKIVDKGVIVIDGNIVTVEHRYKRIKN